MTDAVARVWRSASALVVVIGMMVALFTACCCLELDHAPGADPGPAVHLAGQPLTSQDVTAARDGGHTEQHCEEPSVAVAVGPASVPGPPVIAAAVAPVSMAGRATPRAGTAGPDAPPPSPVPHLLCVMRT